MQNNNPKLGGRMFVGPLFVGIGAMLWATDSLLRFPLLNKLNPILIVLLDHLVSLVVLFPWIKLKYGYSFFRLTLKEWLAAAFVGAAASAIATVLFTASFLFVNPSVSILLQKLQPVLVVLIAIPVLREIPKPSFFLWGLVALGSGVVLSFPMLDFSFLRHGLDVHSRGVFYALSAAGLWAVSTVVGKVLLRRTPSSIATFWRYFFGFVTLAVLWVISGRAIPWPVLRTAVVWETVLYISLIPGLVGMLFYYAGLSRTAANVATFVELLFPVAAVILNTVFLHTPLHPVQLWAGIALLFAVTKISF